MNALECRTHACVQLASMAHCALIEGLRAIVG